MTKICGIGLLVGQWVKVVGWSTFPTGSGSAPAPYIMKLKKEMDDFNKNMAYSMSAVGVISLLVEPARICRFSSDIMNKKHVWLPVSGVEMTVVYENEEEGHVETENSHDGLPYFGNQTDGM